MAQSKTASIIDLSAYTYEGEVWKTIPGHSYYQASTYGRIRSIDRTIKVNGHRRRLKGKVLKQSRNSDRYRKVDLCRQVNGKAKIWQKLVHRLVMLAHVGKAPKGRPHVHHINRDPGSNHLSNLAYVSQSQNMAEHKASGAKIRRFTEAEIVSMQGMRMMGMNDTVIASIHDTRPSRVGRLIGDVEPIDHMRRWGRDTKKVVGFSSGVPLTERLNDRLPDIVSGMYRPEPTGYDNPFADMAMAA